MKIIDFSKQNTIIGKYVSELRDVSIQSDRLRFRQNVIRIGHAMAYEISKSLDYETKKLTTPLAEAVADVPKDDIVIATVFRAGLPLHQGFLDVFDDATTTCRSCIINNFQRLFRECYKALSSYYSIRSCYRFHLYIPYSRYSHHYR